MANGDAARADPNQMPEDVSPRHLGRRLLELAAFACVVAVTISALPGLGSLRARFEHVDPAFLALIFALELASSLSYVITFRDVFCQQLSWRFSYELGMAEQATNVLLPTGGAGGLALGAWALRQGGMATEYIGRRSVAFFMITSSSNFICAAVLGALLLVHVLPGHAPTVVTLVFTIGAFAAIALTAALPPLLARVRPPAATADGGGRLARLLRAGAVTVANGVRDTGALLHSGRPLAIGGATGYMAFDVAALAAAFAAFGGAPPFAPFVLAYVIGQLGGLIPVPGGIGGTDGGLIGALVLYGTPLSQAAASVLVYRAFQLGLPSLFGAAAFMQLRRRLGASDEPAALCAPLAEPIAGAAAERAVA